MLLELLARLKLRPQEVEGWCGFLASEERLAIAIAPLDEGLLLDEVALVAESPLFGQRVMQRRRREKSRDGGDNVIKNLTELREGAPVVHIDHGVGRYQGLVTLEIEGQAQEFLLLQYADEAKLYVPVASLHLIARYTGSDDALAPLHKLGSETWQKAKRKAAEQVRDVAAELLDIYARRAARQGYAFKDPQVDYETFAAGFPFEETPDQQAAIDAVREDLLSAKPMDRLVCGDVGFGKTEVAMRAAFIAVHGGKQVAVLVPTTLLAQQHYNSFRDRFADWPVRVEVMSRFKSAKEVQNAITELADGKIDILIGTHKLLQDDVKFSNLGLVIIDEEHRFGVRQKEQLKALRSEVDILTLTATPIPRTLNMSIAGMRDLSIIATPPARRLSVRTFVMEANNPTIKEALLRELLRGGQVYYLHNDVKTIEKCAADLQALVPEARIAIGHGQMRERDLEQVMSDFYHKRFNVLVASTIIETGIDVPSANTIIIERADKFGLAQLHQLRGRVGRSHHQAYAYLLTPPRKAMTDDAQKRLEAIANAQDLGAGFVLATHDLEIRGAGELLGEGQSGQIQAVGFTLYMEMLERAVKAIRKGEQPNLEQPLGGGPEINLRLPALIPEDYLPDVHARLILYKRIANAADEDGLKELQVEMIDRFGLLPEPTKNLVRLTLLKLQAEKLGITKIDAGPQGGRIEFSADTSVDPMVLIKLIQSQPNRYKFEGATLFKFQVPMERPEERFNTLEALLERLAQRARFLDAASLSGPVVIVAGAAGARRGAVSRRADPVPPRHAAAGQPARALRLGTASPAAGAPRRAAAGAGAHRRPADPGAGLSGAAAPRLAAAGQRRRPGHRHSPGPAPLRTLSDPGHAEAATGPLHADGHDVLGQPLRRVRPAARQRTPDAAGPPGTRPADLHRSRQPRAADRAQTAMSLLPLRPRRRHHIPAVGA